MKKPVLYRLQEFLADKFDSVQYPQPIIREEGVRPKSTFDHGKFEAGLTLFIFGSIVTSIGAVMLFLVWLVFF